MDFWSNNSKSHANESSSFKTTYTWEIPNFSRNFGPINSPDFLPATLIKNHLKFNLKILSRPSTFTYNGIQSSLVLLTLCMKRYNVTGVRINPPTDKAVIDSDNLNRPNLPVYYRISFLDYNGEKHHSQECRAVFKNNTNGTIEEPIEGLEYRISYDYLRESYPQYNNINNYFKARIFCEVLILKDLDENIESQFEQKWQNKKPQPVPKIEIPIAISNSKSNEALDHYNALLESGTLSDVVLVVGKKEFHVHRAILAARSSVFAAMFSNDLEEKLSNRVVIPDLDVEVCELLLPYIYTGKVPSMKEYALELFFASDKYQLDHLKSICEQNLIKTLSIQTVAHTLLLADMYSAAYLKRKCVEYITQNSEQVMATKGWVEMTKARPELLMELYKDISAKANPLLKRTD